MKVVGIKGLKGIIYQMENGSIELDDLGAPVVRSATNGFYIITSYLDYVQEKGVFVVNGYKNKAAFKRAPINPYHSFTFTIKNTAARTVTLPEGITEVPAYTDFDTWFSTDITELTNKSEQKQSLLMLASFTGSSDFELRNSINNIINFSTMTTSTTQAGD